MKEYTFSSLQQEILSGLQKLVDERNYFNGAQNLTVVDGFAHLPVQETVGGGTISMGRSIPMVVVVDEDTGQVWQLALKQLVPRVELQ